MRNSETESNRLVYGLVLSARETIFSDLCSNEFLPTKKKLSFFFVEGKVIFKLSYMYLNSLAANMRQYTCKYKDQKSF